MKFSKQMWLVYIRQQIAFVLEIFWICFLSAKKKQYMALE